MTLGAEARVVSGADLQVPLSRSPKIMEGQMPGASADGVTSLDGNICTKAGAPGTRSTTLRSSTMEAYCSAASSGVLLLSTTSTLNCRL
ncbi:MAG: hypothetical protein IPN77_22470 [Sandaracinaceae bacterium]|nr:hypothetical protein [Sandaracinaceae bacterium]